MGLALAVDHSSTAAVLILEFRPLHQAAPSPIVTRTS